MSKRKRTENDIETYEDIRDLEDDATRRFKEKHSLDSDEDDDNAGKYDVMHEDDIEGQEDGTVDFDGEIQITPFNMKEELEEGHFDKQGMYIFDKKQDIKDSWIDNIDWVRVKEKEKTEEKNEDSSDDEEQINVTQIHKELLEFLKPGESVGKVLRRLGGSGGSLSASQRLKLKKQKGDQKDPRSEADKKNFEKLTELADKLISNGNMDTYELTCEKLSYLVKKSSEDSKTVIPEGTTDDDALDMFADNFDAKNNEKTVKFAEELKVGQADKPITLDKGGDDEDEEVKWEYKWVNEEAEDIHGPFTSKEMMEWTEDNFFPDGVFVRKAGSDGQFYNSKRIDFDLYT